MKDASIISLDIETYGAAKHRKDWGSLPDQKYFHPRKSEYWQGVTREDLVLTCAITVAEADTRVNGCWSKKALAELKPGETFVLEMHRKMDREVLANWIRHADTIIGSNIQFDLLYLRRFDNAFKFLLDGRHTYIDTTIVAYLWNELSSSRSLKKLGPLLGQFTYAESLAGGRFNHVSDEKLAHYNAEDTHNTLLALAALAERMPAVTDKLSPQCVKHYSDAIHSVVEMSEEGIPFSSMLLEQLHDELDEQLEVAREKAEDCGLVLSGKGSAQSKDQFFLDAVKMIEDSGFEGILDLLEITPKTRKVSHSKKNRITLQQHLPESPTGTQLIRDGLKWFGQFQDAQKLLSTYVFPLLLHKRNDPLNFRSSIIPWLTHQPKTASFLTPSATPSGPMTLPLSKSMEKSSTSTQKLSTPSSPKCIPEEQVETQEHCGPLMPPQSMSCLFEQAMKNNSSLTPNRLRLRFPDRRSPARADSAAFPSWFITPSRVKNDQGSEGGTIQGRITCKDPSAQTFPPHIKECMVSRYVGGSIIGIDLSQIELRVAALLSGETSMIDSYINGLDLHADRARSLWPDYDDQPGEQKKRRQVGKMMNFADLFLSSANTMRQQVYAQSGGDINLPAEIFQQVVKTRPKLRPILTQWQRNLIHTAKVSGRVELPIIGQSRNFSNISKERSEIVNFPVQTTASNLMMQIQSRFQAEVHRRFKRGVDSPRMFLQIFDAIYVDCPPSTADIAEDCFNDVINACMSPLGYWGILTSHYKREPIPLLFDVELQENRSWSEPPHEQPIQTRSRNTGAA